MPNIRGVREGSAPHHPLLIMSKCLGIFALVSCLFLAACEQKVKAPAHSDEIKRYALKGKVVKLEKTTKLIEVDHEKIEGFMDAMTMEFAVKDDANFAKLQVGDQITATLIYNPKDNRSWLEELKIMKGL